MKEEEFRRSFRGSPVKRAKLSGLLRNAAIAMATAESENICRVCANWRSMETRPWLNTRAGRLQDWRRDRMATMLSSRHAIHASRILSRRPLDVRARLVAMHSTASVSSCKRERTMFRAAESA